MIAPAKDDRTCLIDMSVLTDILTYSLEQGDLIVARVRAKNSIEYGDYSEANQEGATVKDRPDPVSPPYIGTDIALDKLEVLWDVLTGDATGGDDIDSYKVEYDKGISDWTVLQGDDNSFSLLTSVIVTGLSSGVEYKFRVSAHNDMGWGDPSSEVGFYTFSYPNKPTSVQTAVNNMNVKISWVAPNSNYKAITAYQILMKNVDTGLYYEDTTYCNG